MEEGQCKGVLAIDLEDGNIHRFRANNTVLSLGFVFIIFPSRSNIKFILSRSRDLFKTKIQRPRSRPSKSGPSRSRSRTGPSRPKPERILEDYTWYTTITQISQK